MAPLDGLAPDQRAVLALVLAQGRGYDEIARSLGLSRGAVRDRAHAALEALAPGAAAGVAVEQRGEIADWLLGQGDPADRAATRARLGVPGPGRAWAQSLAAELRPLAREPLPELPPAAAGAPAGPAPARRRSLVAGALLLAAVAGIGVVLVLLLRGNGGGSSASTPAATDAARTATTTRAAQLRTLAQINLQPPGGGRSPLGLGRLVVQNDAAGFVVALQGVRTRSGTYHALWLTGPRVRPLFLGSILNANVRGGRVSSVAPVPRTVARYRAMLLTRERTTASGRKPARPGATVLRGGLAVRGALPSAGAG